MMNQLLQLLQIQFLWINLLINWLIVSALLTTKEENSCCQETFGLIVGHIAGNDAHLPQAVSTWAELPVTAGKTIQWVSFVVSARFLLCCHRDINPLRLFISLLIISAIHERTSITVFLFRHMTFVTSFASRHVANEKGQVCYMLSLTVITPAVSQVSLSSADVILFAFVYVDWSWNSHICLSHRVSSVKIDSLIIYFTTVDWQASFIFSITFFVYQINHSLMLSCNFTLHSCSYRRPSICN